MRRVVSAVPSEDDVGVALVLTLQRRAEPPVTVGLLRDGVSEEHDPVCAEFRRGKVKHWKRSERERRGREGVCVCVCVNTWGKGERVVGRMGDDVSGGEKTLPLWRVASHRLCTTVQLCDVVF